MSLEIKSFDSPDETRPFADKGSAAALSLAGGTALKGTFEPGWRWSEHVKPLAGTDSCQAAHLGYVLSGRMHVVMDDGTEGECGRRRRSIPPDTTPRRDDGGRRRSTTALRSVAASGGAVAGRLDATSAGIGSRRLTSRELGRCRPEARRNVERRGACERSGVPSATTNGGQPSR